MTVDKFRPLFYITRKRPRIEPNPLMILMGMLSTLILDLSGTSTARSIEFGEYSLWGTHLTFIAIKWCILFWLPMNLIYLKILKLSNTRKLTSFLNQFFKPSFFLGLLKYKKSFQNIIYFYELFLFFCSESILIFFVLACLLSYITSKYVFVSQNILNKRLQWLLLVQKDNTE